MQAIEPINNIAVDLSLPVLKEPMARNDFVAHLRAAQQTMFPDEPLPRLRQLRFNDCTAAIKLFEDFIHGKELLTINPKETLLDEFLDYLIKDKSQDKHRYCQSLCNNLRNLINHFSANILQRPLVNAKHKEYLTRYDHLSQKTRDIINDFTKDGRKLNRKRQTDGRMLSNKLLAPRSRESVGWAVSNFLKGIGKTCLLKVTPKDAEVFINFHDAKGRRDLALKYLANLQPVFLNMMGKGIRNSNPIEKYNERQPSRIDDDFIMPEQMGKLQDLSTVDFKDIWDVRDRMMTFACYYDFCLRNSEAALLKCPNVVLDEELVGVTLGPEIQKGQDKPVVTLYNCFAESRRLIQAYLELRAEFTAKIGTKLREKTPGRQVDAFIISKTGMPLGNTGCLKAVQNHCNKLGIKTRKGNIPYPHCLRHTYASTNIDKLGLCLSPYFIQGRLRHSDLATTIKIYVQNNPLLAKQNHIANVQQARGLNNNLSATSDSIALPRGDVRPTDFSMPEAEAARALRGCGISAKSLRQYAKANEIIGMKNGKHFYSRSFISDLSRNFLTKQQVMKRLKFGGSRFYVWKKARGIEPVVIGKISLVKASDVITELKK